MSDWSCCTCGGVSHKPVPSWTYFSTSFGATGFGIQVDLSVNVAQRFLASLSCRVSGTPPSGDKPCREVHFTESARVFQQTNGEGLKFYFRIAPCVKAIDQPAEGDLEKLADFLQASGPVRGPAPDTDIPAAYTYLGQFIAHELPNLGVLDPEGEIPVRLAALDPDSLFGAVPENPLPEQAQIWKGGVGIGQARSFGRRPSCSPMPKQGRGIGAWFAFV